MLKFNQRYFHYKTIGILKNLNLLIGKVRIPLFNVFQPRLAAIPYLKLSGLIIVFDTYKSVLA